MAETEVTPERENLIVRTLLKHMLAKKEMLLKRGAFRRELGSVAKVVDIPAKELRAVCGKVLKEMVDESLLEDE